MTNVTTIGLDIAKSSFTLHGCDAKGAAVLKKTLKRAQVLKFFAELPPCRVGLEACGSAHYWARELAKLGHDDYSDSAFNSRINLCTDDQIAAA